MKLSISVILLLLAMSCTDIKNNDSDSDQKRPIEAMTKSYNAIGIWESDCIQEIGKRKIKVEFKINGEFIKDIEYFGKEEGCNENDIMFTKNIRASFVLGNNIAPDIYELNLTDEKGEARYFTIKANEHVLLLSNGSSSSPDVRITSYFESEKLNKL